MKHKNRRLNIREWEEQYHRPGNYWNNPVKEQSFLKMRRCGKESVYNLHKRFSTREILELLEMNDIYPVNFVDGWKENSEHWNQEQYDRMKKEFFKGFKEGLYELIKINGMFKIR